MSDLRAARPEPPLTGSEVEVLTGFLDHHRATIRWKVEGLDAGDLDQLLPPSTMTLGGMLKHLAYVESNWLSEVMLAGPAMEPFASADWASDRDWEWHSAVDDTPEELLALYDAAIAASDAILADLLRAGGLDQLSRRTIHGGEHVSLRWVLVHLVEEYARHVGHADLLRESIDGSVGM